MTYKSGWRHNTTADNTSRRSESWKPIPSDSERPYLGEKGVCSTTQHPPSQLLRKWGRGEAPEHPGQAQTSGCTDVVNMAQLILSYPA
jgi:hypothetical protein